MGKNELKCLREERALAAEHRRFQQLEEEMVQIRKELGDKEQRIAALENCCPNAENCCPNAPLLEAPVTKPMQVQVEKKFTPPPPPPAASGQSPFDLRNSLPSVRALVATFEQRSSANSPTSHVSPSPQVRTPRVRDAFRP